MNILGVIFAAYLSSATVTLRDCGNPNTDQAKILSMGFNPTNPLPNENTTLWIDYQLRTPITSGTATYSLSLNGIPFSPTIQDLCTQTACPKLIGIYNETSSSLFPEGITGKIVSKIQWKNQDNLPVLCQETTFKIT
jgi:hypothetical protein